jgi:xanthine dehydrogenase YagS FAD-binding subunit
MKPFEYAAPRDEAGVLALLSPEPGHTEILAGGTDLVPLMQKMIVTPRRVVNIKEVAPLRRLTADSQGVVLGAAVTLEEMLDAPELASYTAVLEAIRGIDALQLISQMTLGGELCRRPQCWYFRNGHGLLAEAGRRVLQGDNRYHAILGNDGPAKFVHASRLAPALMALGAEVRVRGPGQDDEQYLPLADFFRTPRHERERETVLAPNQFLTHVFLPNAEGWLNATYEVKHGRGPAAPLAAASAALLLDGGRVADARVVLGHVAPVPWRSPEAQAELIGRPVSPETAARAGRAAVASATPLSHNAYKVDLAAVAVERAILKAAGLPTGGF